MRPGPCVERHLMERQVLGNSHLDTLNLIISLACIESKPSCLSCFERQLLGNSHPITPISISNLASLFRAQGKLAEAELLFREADEPEAL